MDVKQSYDEWAAQYDVDTNLTRDLEGVALRKILDPLTFETCLEIGCGTGKNTSWFIDKASKVTAVDFSSEMLAKAKEKVKSDKVIFVQADVTQPWTFTDRNYDLISFSLILEHIEDVTLVFKNSCGKLKSNGYIYIGELHPFKQYTGSKAKFETKEGTQVLQSFIHHISDYILAAESCGLKLILLNEYFDDKDRNKIPRVLAILMQKQA